MEELDCCTRLHSFPFGMGVVPFSWKDRQLSDLFTSDKRQMYAPLFWVAQGSFAVIYGSCLL